MQALFDEDDDLYQQISSRTDSLDNSALSMTLPEET